MRLDRVDRVDPPVLFGLVDGELDKLDITQPPEGLHFKLPQKANDIWRDQAGGGVLGVLDVKKLRKALQLGDELGDGGGAEFAKKIIAQQLRGVFKLEAENPL